MGLAIIMTLRFIFAKVHFFSIKNQEKIPEIHRQKNSMALD